jgi:thioredoxin 1
MSIGFDSRHQSETLRTAIADGGAAAHRAASEPCIDAHICGQEPSMSDSKFLAVTDASFEQQVLSAPGPVLLKFEADWCGPCQAMKPMIEDLARDYAGRVTVATIDVDQNNQVPYRLGVRGVPTVMLFKNGEVVAQKVGLPRKADLAALLDSKLN